MLNLGCGLWELCTVLVGQGALGDLLTLFFRVYPLLQHLLCLAFLPASALLLRAVSYQIKAWVQSKEGD